MRILGLVIVHLVTLKLFAQSGFDKQFKAIIKDTSNGFPNFRKPQRDSSGDNFEKYVIRYQAIFNIPETEDNIVLISEVKIIRDDTTNLITYSYNARMLDSLKEGKARKLCDDWRDRLSGILGSGFIVKEFENRPWLPGKYGWKFSNKELIVSLDVVPLANSNLNVIWLSISYTTYKLRYG